MFCFIHHFVKLALLNIRLVEYSECVLCLELSIRRVDHPRRWHQRRQEEENEEREKKSERELGGSQTRNGNGRCTVSKSSCLLRAHVSIRYGVLKNVQLFGPVAEGQRNVTI